MSKKIMMTLLAGVCLLTSATAVTESTNAQTVQAATTKGKVQVKGNKKVRLYTSKGKRSRYYAYAGRKYSYSTKSYIKIGKKKYSAYKLSANSYWILAKDVKTVKSTTSTVYSQASIILPSGYTRAALLKAYMGNPSEAFIKASMQGMEINDFSRVASGETAADEKMIDPAHLSASDKKTLAEFSLRVINSAREQLGLRPWVYSTGTQKLADDIAKEYQENGRSIKDNGHYVAGIVRACKKNGLKLDDNYVEDMAGFTINKQKMPMGEMKRNIYFGLKQMIFGFAGSGENQRSDRNLYREWEHAGDLFNTQGSSHDGDYNYYGFSISKTNNIYSMHFISVPSFIVDSSQYNGTFKP